jgi:hypothetical protein
MLDSKLLFTQHLHTLANKATGVFCNIFPLLARDSAFTQSNKVTIYKLLIRSILTYAAPFWSSTCYSNYLRLQVIQSKCLLVIGNHPRPTTNSHLHNTLNIEPIRDFIHRLTAKFFAHWPSHPNPLVLQIGNYTLANLTNLYKKYKNKRTKHIQWTLESLTPSVPRGVRLSIYSIFELNFPIRNNVNWFNPFKISKIYAL